VPAEPELLPIVLPALEAAPPELAPPELLPLEPWMPGLATCWLHAKTAEEISNAARPDALRSSVVEFSAIPAILAFRLPLSAESTG